MSLEREDSTLEWELLEILDDDEMPPEIIHAERGRYQCTECGRIHDGKPPELGGRCVNGCLPGIRKVPLVSAAVDAAVTEIERYLEHPVLDETYIAPQRRSKLEHLVDTLKAIIQELDEQPTAPERLALQDKL